MRVGGLLVRGCGYERLVAERRHRMISRTDIQLKAYRYEGPHHLVIGMPGKNTIKALAFRTFLEFTDPEQEIEV